MNGSIRILMLLLMGGSLLQAQPPGKGPRSHNMEAVRIWRLVEVLELTEDQTVKFLPMVQIHERKLRAAQQEIELLTEKSEKLLAQPTISQEDVNKMIRQYTERQKKMHAIRQEFMRSLPEYLTPRQQLLYLGFEARFRKDLRQYMKDHRFNPEAKRFRKQ